MRKKLDSFYNDYAEIIRLKGVRHMTVFDFVVVCNVRLFLEVKEITVAELTRRTGLSSINNFINLKTRFSADKIYKIAQAMDVALSEFYVDRSEFMGESPTFRF